MVPRITEYIRRLKNPAYSSIALAVFSLLSLFLYPCFLPSRTYADDPLPINPSLTIGSSGTLAFDVTPGQFNSGSQSISVATSNYTGYNLTIAPVSGDSTALVNSVTSSTIPSIATDSTESTFASPSYGFTTDSTITSSTLYKPVLNGTTIKETNTAGTDNFNLTVGAKIASNTPAGTYTKQFTLTATANPAAYSISYNANAGSDTVTNFPSNDESSVVGDTVTISSKTPVRSGYLFVGWAETSTAYEATLQPSGTFIVDQTIDNPTKILYAVWAAPLQNWDGCGDLSVGDIVPLYDTRDNQVYKVSKYKMKADGSTTACWMSNLNLGAESLTVSTLDSSNTHLPADGSKDISATTFGTWIKSRGTWTYADAELIPITSSNSANGSDTDSYGSKYGTLYNYNAASAGTVAGDSYLSNAEYDLCPSGWRLPTGGSSGEFQAFYNANSPTPATMQSDFAFSLAGYFLNSTPNGQGSSGYYWSSTRYSNTNMYYLYFDSSSASPSSSNRRDTSYSIRCIKDKPIMQNVSEWADSVAEGETITAMDSRDGNDYSVARINNRLWMTQNLRITGTIPASGSNFTGSDFNVSEYDLTDSTNCTEEDVSVSNPLGFSNVCSKTGVDSEGNPTAWYDFAAASAGTVKGYSNTSSPTGDICPSGWRLPTNSEQTNLVSTLDSDYTIFRPVYSGVYFGGTLSHFGTYGLWWSSDSSSYVSRYRIAYVGDALDAGSGSHRVRGYSVRCIKDEPTMQEVSSWGDSLTEGQEMTAVDSRDGSAYTVARIGGQLWMTQNLRITGTIPADGSNFTGSDFNVSEYDLETDGATYCSGIDVTSEDPKGFTNVCSHIGVDSSGVTTGWYNFPAASAGTVVGYPNSNPTTGDICPSGWRLPSITEEEGLISALGSSPELFKPVTGGGYYNGNNTDIGVGRWWSLSASGGNNRGFMSYKNTTGTLQIGAYSQFNGFYIRCIKKDVPVMQDVATWGSTVANGSEITAVDSRDGNEYTVARLGNRLWMTQNLRITGIIPAEGSNFTGSDFNVSQYDLADSVNCIETDSSEQNPKGYSNVCSKVGVDDNSDPTAWYDFAAASAGTVTGYNNLNAPTGDICPSGWRLPTNAEQNSLLSVIGSSGTGFNLVHGGFYDNGSLDNASDRGYWWSSTVRHDHTRYSLRYNGNNLDAYYHVRWLGFYVRCIKNDLILQEVDSWAGNVPLGETVEAVDIRDGQTYKASRYKMSSDGSSSALWMSNLNLGAETLTVSELNNSNSDMPTATAVNKSTFESWIKTSGTASYTNPELIPITASNSADGHAEDSYGNKYGTLYNYAAVTADTINAAAGTNDYNASNSLCPRGWRLPTGDSSGEFKLLADANSITNDSIGATKFQSDLGFSLAGTFGDDVPKDQNYRGYYWSSSRFNGERTYRVRFDSSEVRPVDQAASSSGRSTRCIEQGPIRNLTITYGTGVVGVTIDGISVSNGATVEMEENASHAIDMTFSSGYEFDSWSATSGTLGSASTQSTTYTIGSTNATLTASAKVSSKTLTVVYGTGVASVTVGGNTVANNGTVSLVPNQAYNINMTFSSGYEFDNWSISGTGASVGSTSTQSTTVTIGSTDATLTASAKVPKTYMQNWSGCSSLAVSETVTLYDNRDEQAYTVGKLKMNAAGTSTACWMMENLNLGAQALVVSTLD
ncbi:InlB B-repeat-containing protein, partial [Candidatus Saccharibacteria bacterium]|nr:InlB B-repeat-containing protein [Candidatus Saccharibacteria bacterium]